MLGPEDRIGPEWLAHRYDPEHDAVHLLRCERSLRRSAPFLTDEHLAVAGEPVIASRRDALEQVAAPSPIHFIFHSAYCCSTLLANAFDDPGIASSLKEPTIFNDLVGWRHRGGPPEQVGQALDSALALLARPFEPHEAMVIKPSNVANALVPAMLALRPQAGAVLLFAPLRVYLRSIAGKGLWGRLWVRDLLAKQIMDGLLDGLGFESRDYLLLSDLQVAAVGWLAQHRLFAQTAERFGDRVRTLQSEILLDRPEDALEQLDRLFGLGQGAARRRAAVDRVFSRHAKFGGAYDRTARSADQRSVAEAHGDEIETVAAWADSVAATAGVAMELPSPLL